MLTSLTMQEAILKNIGSDTQAGITFIEGEGDTEYMSYKKLYIEARYALYNLQQQGLKPGDELVFQFLSNKNFLITFWACVFGQIVPVPLVFGVTADIMNKVAKVWGRLKNPCLITDLPTLKNSWKESNYGKAGAGIDIDAKFLFFEGNIYTKQAPLLPSHPSDLAFIQFSSGSTGHPKGVQNTQESIMYSVNTMSHLTSIESSDKFLGWMPLTHDLGLVFFHIVPMLKNLPQFLIPPMVFFSNPNLWLKSLAVNGITVSGSPNFGYRYAEDKFKSEEFSGLSFSNMRMMINGAEMVSADYCRSFEKLLAPYGFPARTIAPAYGLAEAVLGVAVFQKKEELSRELFVNRHKLKVGESIEFVNADSPYAVSFANLGPYTGTAIKITNAEMQTLPDNWLGLIHLKSTAVTTGFYNDDVTTQKTVSEDGWLNTGDLGFITNGRLVITGRSKEMILINGQNYFPRDIDTIIEELPEIHFQQAVSCNIFNEEKFQDDIVVFLQYKGAAAEFTVLENKIKKHVGERTGLWIKKAVAVDRIPKTTSGKIQRYVLSEEYQQGKYDEFIKEVALCNMALQKTARNLSQKQIEEKILVLLKELFDITDPGLTSNFFDLGLTSLQIVKLKVNIESFLFKELDEIALFKYNNIKELSAYICTDVIKTTTTPASEQKSTPLSSDRIRRFIKSS
jgi:acyl-CoA synthetase (AMP-forming)/AMP-acid ligase II/acyl carrier protein